MHESRRVFLGLAFGAAATAAVGASPQSSTPQGESPVPPPISGFPIPPLPRRNLEELKANQASIKKDVTRLSELVGELQKGLDNNDTKEVLPLD